MENQPNFRRPYPSLPQAWVLFLIFIAMNFGGGFLMMPFQNSARNLGFFLTYTVIMGATYFVASKLKEGDTGRIKHNFKLGNILIYPILLLTTWACLLYIVPIIELYPPPEWLQKVLERMIDTSSVWAFFSLVVAAPIFEELIFRGIILDGFLKQYSVRKSILWSSFFFGLFHLNPWQFVTAMILGVFIGWIYHRTRSLLPCMAIHAFANGTTFLISNTADQEQADMTLVETVGGVSNLLLILVVAGGVLFFAIKMLDRLLPQPSIVEVEVENDDIII